MTYKDHLDNLRKETVASAQKAVDFLDGDIRKWLEELLSTPGAGIKDWKARGVRPIWENVVASVVTKRALVYQQPVDRGVWIGEGENKNATETLNEILYESNYDGACEHVDVLSSLIGTSLMLAQYVNETGEIFFSSLSRHNADIHINPVTGVIESLMYTAGTPGARGGQLFHHWTPETITDVEIDKGQVREVGPSEKNIYGMIPVAIRHDTTPPRVGIWKKAGWEQLVYLNEGINMFHTEIKFNARYGAIGSPVTDMDIADGTVCGPDYPLKAKGSIPGQTPYFEFKAPQVNVDAFLPWLDGLRSTVADQWGVNLKVAGDGSANSGFQLVVEEFPSLQLAKKRIKAAREFERKMYNVLLVLSEAHNLGLPADSVLYADFKEPALPVDTAGEWAITKEKLAIGYTSLEDEWRREDPDLSDKDIAARKARINGPAVTFDFGGGE